ncbi:MAG TPA: response regulator transcription factor [Puia sp.]|jgi:RNA polymerase sigma factor (sigma-70 family)|nr:response regulator transcription factor [Puia sp.]
MTSIGVSIIEDIADIRHGLERIIADAPDFLLLSSYDNAEDAISSLPDIRPDIVIADIQLPGLSGIDCIRLVKAVCPSVQFMMFTIYEDSEQVFEALEAGANGYLLKQTPQDRILDAIRELHQGGSPMSSGIARRVVSSFRKQALQSADANVLSARESEVLQLLAKGLLYKEIGQRLQISTGTVRQHIHKIYGKLQVQNKTEAINKAFRK